MGKKKESQSGLMSSAGLMRYYEADETTYHMDPKIIMIGGVLIGIILLVLNYRFGLWP
ncbi:MAG: preprotein translocase subunit Sec61beta [ANME-2 cluster archaeon]|nr:preprotein translocase subunit Sec61beta [ANME-2 cluster archaeon]MBC2702628.1 preprotein translocase subunit Sec61beta [ANME-2 cluster archaeon]MBC2708107.1 preprotein translocase subunit Sec61beta [ANME-2 cluster archaeon]MBC2745589.1 preprotein translocase subunit Sec61beta [ANME-2 cluster archaeon]MBC2763408.1 preprotein translocase subunit Sec61beta [ANME-2 cluster archaeon]